MKSKLSSFLLILFALLLTSCSDTYGQLELYELAREEEPDIEIVLPKTLNDGVKCSDYTEGCLGGKRAKLRRVLITIVEFENEKQAKKAATAIDQYYARNWVFDDVTDEPVLESFVKKVFDAKRPALDLKNKEKDK